MSNQSSGQWQAGDILLDQYKVVGVLGQTELGEVYRVRHLGWNIDLAAYSVKSAAIENLEQMEAAVTAWIHLHPHPHLANCYYLRRVAETPLVFAESVSGGSLRQWLQDRRLYQQGNIVALRRILDIAIQIAWGLHHAHQQGVVHQNLRPETVLLTAEGVAKVTHLGLVTAPIPYRAPEQMQQLSATRQTDLWSWGLLLLEMFAGQATWSSGLMAMQMLDRYLDSVVPEIPPMPAALVPLLRRCFQENPADRPDSFQSVAEELQAIYQTATGSSYPRRAPVLTGTAADQMRANHLNNQALALWDLGQQEEALQLWQQALALNSHHMESLYNRGLLWWRAGGSSDQDLLDQLEASRPQPDDRQTDYLVSLVHMERGDYEAALRLLESIQARGGQSEILAPILEQVRTHLPQAKRLLPDFGDRASTFQRSAFHHITSLALSPNGRFVFSGGEDQTIRVWEITTGRCLYTFRGHQGAVTAVALNSDGNQLISGSDDKTIKLWNVASTSHLFTFGGAPDNPNPVGPLRRIFGGSQPRTSSGNGHKGGVRAVAFSFDRRYLLSGGDDGVLKLWDVASGKCLQTLREHRAAIFAVAFSPDGRRALSGSADQTIKLWDVSAGRVIQTLQGHHHLSAVAYSPSGQYVLAGDIPIKLWDITTGRVVQTFNDPDVRTVAFSPDQRYIFSGNRRGQMKLWEAVTGRCLRTFDAHEAEVRSIVVSTDGHYALSCDANSLKLWAVHCETPLELAPLKLAQMPVAAHVLTGDRLYEQEVAQGQAALERKEPASAVQHLRRARSQSGYQRGMEAIQAWLNLYSVLPRQSLQDCWEQANLERHTAAVTAVAFTSDSSAIFSGSADFTLKRWDRATERCTLSFEGHQDRVEAIALSPDRNQVLSASADQTLRLWDANTGECLRILSGHQGTVSTVAYANRYAISGSQDQTLKLWDLLTGRCLRTLQCPSAITTTAISLDGRCLISGGDRSLTVWDFPRGEVVRTIEGHENLVRSVAINPVAHQALSGSDDQSLKLWNLATGDCMRTFVGHSAGVNAVAISPDGQYAVSGSADRKLKLWNLSTGGCLKTLSGHQEAVLSVSFSPDGRYLVSGSADHQLKLWLLDWELIEREPADWDEAATPFLEVFLTRLKPTAQLPDLREPSQEAITQALTPSGTPVWGEADFNQFIQWLQNVGYGWLRPEGVRQQLLARTQAAASTPEPLARTQAAATSTPEATVFPTEFATAFATAFATEFAEPQTATVRLTVTEGTLTGQEYVFSDRTVCIIGRAKDCHLPLPNDENHKTVSRYHCLLEIDPPAIRIRDLGSLHGTFVNDQMIGRRSPDQTPEQGMQLNQSGYDLYHGDEIKLGKTVFRVSSDVPPDDSTRVNQTAIGDATAMIDRTHFQTSVGSGLINSVSDSSSPVIAGYTVVRQLQHQAGRSTYLVHRANSKELVTLTLFQPEKIIQPTTAVTFLQNLEIIKSLQHPHIVRLQEVGYTNAMFFLISAYAEVSTLKERVQQGRLSSGEAIAITLQLLDGLQYAHQTGAAGRQGIVHGSINPDQILLTGTLPTAQIADYGIASALAHAGLSSLSSYVNLPAFMPRQQVIDFKYAQPEADIWAVAACLYYMLTGTYPRNFSGKDPYLIVLQTDPVPIRQREATIPAALADLVDLALVDNPGVYFKNAAAFKQALASLGKL